MGGLPTRNKNACSSPVGEAVKSRSMNVPLPKSRSPESKLPAGRRTSNSPARALSLSARSGAETAAAKGAWVPGSTSTAQPSLAKAASKRPLAALGMVPRIRGVFPQENGVPSMPTKRRPA